MNAEIITTGTEILLGEIVDTNAAWMARRLRDLGVNLYYKTSVGDNETRIASVMRQALGRSDLVLVTGGLGPTVDDVTRQAAARATGRELVLHESCWADIQALFRQWGRAPGENNRRQAYLPQGAIPIVNPVGTAPGFIVEMRWEERLPSLLICLPGVPREMKHLMEHMVEPFLYGRMGDDLSIIKARVLHTVGMGESGIDARLNDLMQGDNPTVGLAAHLGQVDVRITARAGNEVEAAGMIDVVAEDIYDRLGRFIYGEDEDELEAVLLDLLRRSGHTLALLESNSRGELAQRLQAIPDAGSLLPLSRTITSLSELGDGGPDNLVSAEAASWAATRLLEQADGKATLALTLCGDMDPKAGPYGSLRGQTFLALAAPHGVVTHRINLGGTGELSRRWMGNAALNWLRLWLLDGE